MTYYDETAQYELDFYCKEATKFFSRSLKNIEQEDNTVYLNLIRDWLIYFAADKTFLNKDVHGVKGSKRPGLVKDSNLVEIGKVWNIDKNEVRKIMRSIEKKLTAVENGEVVLNKDCTPATEAMVTIMHEFQRALMFKDEYVPHDEPTNSPYFSYAAAGWDGSPFNWLA